MLTPQEIYTRVRNHLLTQKVAARANADGICVYKNEAGLKCAVGCLIPDEAYQPELEGVTPGGKYVQGSLTARQADLHAALKAGGVDVGNMKVLELLSMLQNVHDSYLPATWAASLDTVANQMDLKVEA